MLNRGRNKHEFRTLGLIPFFGINLIGKDIPKPEVFTQHEILPLDREQEVVVVEASGLALIVTCFYVHSLDSIRKYGLMDQRLQRYVETDQQIYSTSIYCGAVLGFLLVGLGFLGTCSSFIESQFLLITYAVLLLLIIIVHTTMGLVLHWFRTGHRSLEASKRLIQAAVGICDCEFWMTIQENLQCCGVDGNEISGCSQIAPCNQIVIVGNCSDLMFNASADLARCTAYAILPILVIELVAILFAVHHWKLIQNGIRLYQSETPATAL